MVPIDSIHNRDAAASATEAAEFLKRFHRCEKINWGYLAWWCPGLFGVFRFHVAPKTTSVKDTVWVVVHNAPPGLLFGQV